MAHYNAANCRRSMTDLTVLAMSMEYLKGSMGAHCFRADSALATIPMNSQQKTGTLAIVSDGVLSVISTRRYTAEVPSF